MGDVSGREEALYQFDRIMALGHGMAYDGSDTSPLALALIQARAIRMGHLAATWRASLAGDRQGMPESLAAQVAAELNTIQVEARAVEQTAALGVPRRRGGRDPVEPSTPEGVRSGCERLALQIGSVAELLTGWCQDLGVDANTPITHAGRVAMRWTLISRQFVADLTAAAHRLCTASDGATPTLEQRRDAVIVMDHALGGLQNTTGAIATILPLIVEAAPIGRDLIELGAAVLSLSQALDAAAAHRIGPAYSAVTRRLGSMRNHLVDVELALDPDLMGGPTADIAQPHLRKLMAAIAATIADVDTTLLVTDLGTPEAAAGWWEAMPDTLTTLVGLADEALAATPYDDLASYGSELSHAAILAGQAAAYAATAREAWGAGDGGRARALLVEAGMRLSALDPLTWVIIEVAATLGRPGLGRTVPALN